jgi:hypothetical protein
MDELPPQQPGYAAYPRPQASPDFSPLKRSGWIKIGVGFAMALPLMILVAAIAVAVPDAAAFLGLLALILRIGGVVTMGIGMADVAESKGHGRGHGWWVLLFLIGLLIVALLPDRYAQR